MTDERQPKPADLTLEAGISAGGASAGVSATMEVLRFLMPKRRATEIMLDDFASRVRRGEVTDGDAQLLERVASKEHARWAWEQQVFTRATEVLALPPAPTSGDPPSQELPPLRTPSDEWLEKFRDDVGLVSDEVLQEVYARILAGEVRAPGSCSLRTLRALRYLDHETAGTFRTAASLAFLPGWVPASGRLLKKHGLAYLDRAELEEAGLLRNDEGIGNHAKVEKFHGTYGHWAFRLSGYSEWNLPIYPLTRAGLELWRVADVSHSAEYFFDTLRFFKSKIGCWVEWIDIAKQADPNQVPEDAWIGLP